MTNVNSNLKGENKKYFFDEKSLLVEDSDDTGLERVIVDRNSFFHGEEVVKYFKKAKQINICGVALGFFITNKAFVEAVKDILKSGGRAEFLVAHPDSEIVKYRDNEEQWLGKLREVIDTTIKELLKIKKEYPDNVSIYLFKGEIHNTIITTEDVIMFNPYIFGKRGWHSPAFVFSKKNPTIISGFGQQLEEMKKYGEENSGVLVELQNKEDYKNI